MSTETVCAPQLRLHFDHQPSSTGGTTSPPVTPPIGSQDDKADNKLPQVAATSAAEIRRRRAEKRAAKAAIGFDADMRTADASFTSKSGDKALRRQGNKLAKAARLRDESTSDEESSSEDSSSGEEEEDDDDDDDGFDDGGAAYDASNQAAIDAQNASFEVEKRGRGVQPRSRKQKVIKKLQNTFPCFNRGGAAISAQTAVSDKDVADLLSGVARTSSSTFDVEGQADSPAPRGTTPTSVEAFTLDDDADDLQFAPPPIAALPQGQTRQVGLSMAVEEDDT